MKRVLIIGGYGNFGSFISKRLAADKNIQLIIAGRSLKKAEALVSNLTAVNAAKAAALDIHHNLSESLAALRPDIVIHTSGPFQAQDYHVARACIEQGCHYIDLADGREFVAEIGTLNAMAKDKAVAVISGASSVPCLTSAVMDHYQSKFKRVEALDYGISTAQKTARGLATTAAILSYTGKPFTTLINGKMTKIYGWQGLHRHKYSRLGYRLLGNCNVPDLALFPERYPDLKTIRFYAGLEIPFVHLTLWVLSGLVRIGLICHLERAAPLLLKMSYWFDWLGSANSAFHMTLSGVDDRDQPKSLTFELIAKSGDGPYIPCMPAILLAQRFAAGETLSAGAYPAVGLISLTAYLQALDGLHIEWT